MTKKITILFLFLSTFLFAEKITEVPINKEPSHHQVLDNDSVRVFDVVVAPHAATLMHRHDRDYTFVILGDADLSNERMDEKPVHMVLNDGDVRYSKGGFAHIARNLGEAPFHNVTIELKNPGAPVCGTDPSKACGNNDQTMQKLFSTEHVVAQMTVLDAGQQTPLHAHAGPHLAIAVDDLAFENHVSDKPSVPISMKKGELKWITVTGTEHYLKNVGNGRGRLFSLEFN